MIARSAVIRIILRISPSTSVGARVDAYEGRSIGGVRDQSAPTDGRGI